MTEMAEPEVCVERPDDDYLKKLGTIVYMAAYLEGMVLGDLPPLTSAIPARSASTALSAS